MRHGKKNNHLGRKAAHRSALLMNLANSLIVHKRITTTLAKAKELRKYLEPIVTKAKDDSTHSRRIVFSYLQNKEAVTELFREISGKVAERNGGYLRIIKLTNRQGDNAEMAMIEFVDYNTTYVKETKSSTKKRTRRAGKPGEKTAGTTAAKKEAATEKPVEKEESKPETEESAPAAEEAASEE